MHNNRNFCSQLVQPRTAKGINLCNGCLYFRLVCDGSWTGMISRPRADDSHQPLKDREIQKKQPKDRDKFCQHTEKQIIKQINIKSMKLEAPIHWIDHVSTTIVLGNQWKRISW